MILWSVQASLYICHSTLKYEHIENFTKFKQYATICARTQHVAYILQRGILLLALLTSLGPLSIDMYLPALPAMASEFGVSTQMVANSLPAYFLGLGLGQLIYGPLSDRIGM